jgi:hypothetical protein
MFFFMSLGFHTWAAVVLPMNAIRAEDGKIYFAFSEAPPRQFILTDFSTTSAVRGVPVEPAHSSVLPASLMDSGQALHQTLISN